MGRRLPGRVEHDDVSQRELDRQPVKLFGRSFVMNPCKHNDERSHAGPMARDWKRDALPALAGAAGSGFHTTAICELDASRGPTLRPDVSQHGQCSTPSPEYTKPSRLALGHTNDLLLCKR